MNYITSTGPTFTQKQELLELWNTEYPRNLQYQNIVELESYLDSLETPNHIFILGDNGKIQGWYCDFYRDNEKWFLAIIAAEFQDKKYGSALMDLAKENNEELNGWVITDDHYFKSNNELYRSPVNFYRKQGFEILENIILQTERISAVKIRWFRTAGTNI